MVLTLLMALGQGSALRAQEAVPPATTTAPAAVTAPPGPKFIVADFESPASSFEGAIKIDNRLVVTGNDATTVTPNTTGGATTGGATTGGATTGGTTVVVPADPNTVAPAVTTPVVATIAHDGLAAGRIDADFSDPRARSWLMVRKAVDLRNEVSALSFWVKSTSVQGLLIQLVDSTRQTLQLRPRFTPDGEWQQIMIGPLETGPGLQAYGGVADKKVRWPLVAINIVVEKKSVLNGLRGSVWLDQVELQTVGEPLGVLPTFAEATQNARAVPLADFENNESGFTGRLVRDAAAGKDSKAAGRIDADLATAVRRAEVAATRTLAGGGALAGTPVALCFWYKSSGARLVTLRLQDGGRRTLQYRLPLIADNTWRQAALTSFERGNGFTATDAAGAILVGAARKPQWPLQSLTLALEKSNLDGGRGTLWVDSIEIFVMR